MSIRDPQIGLRPGLSGAADIWDEGVAGLILTSDYFETAVVGFTLELGRSILSIGKRDFSNSLSSSLSSVEIGFSGRDFSQSQLFNLSSSILKWAAKSVEQGGEGGISLETADLAIAILSQSAVSSSEVGRVSFTLEGKDVLSSYLAPPPELDSAGFNFKTSTCFIICNPITNSKFVSFHI
jgi:hypothetical protein